MPAMCGNGGGWGFAVGAQGARNDRQRARNGG